MKCPTIDELPCPPQGLSGWPWTIGSGALPLTRPEGGAWPKVTVVTPSFQQGRFLEETIRSVLLQGYPSLEYMVFDGGSTDETIAILERYEPWLTYWVSESDRGQTHAINKGLERATGEIFCYLNSDDFLAPDALGAVASAMSEDEHVDVVYGECVYVDETGSERWRHQGRITNFLDYLRIWDRFVAGDFLTQPEVFCRTRQLIDAGGFREELHSVMDFEMWLRLLSKGCHFESIDVPLACFRTYVAQKSSVDPGYELCRVLEEYIRESASVPAELRPQLEVELGRARAHFLVRAAIAANMRGMYGTAARYCWAALAGHPRIALTHSFWAALGNPVRKWLPLERLRTLRRFVHRAGG